MLEMLYHVDVVRQDAAQIAATTKVSGGVLFTFWRTLNPPT